MAGNTRRAISATLVLVIFPAADRLSLIADDPPKWPQRRRYLTIMQLRLLHPYLPIETRCDVHSSGFLGLQNPAGRVRFEPTVRLPVQTVFEFDGSHARACRPIPKRMDWFANFEMAVLSLIPSCAAWFICKSVCKLSSSAALAWMKPITTFPPA